MKTYLIKLELLDPDRKVKIIKHVRNVLDVGLKEAKHLVEGTQYLPLKSVGILAFVGLTNMRESIKIHLFVHEGGPKRIIQDKDYYDLPKDPDEAAIVLQLLWHKDRMSALYVQLAEIKGLTP